jgi:hypothetical protein
VYVPHVDDVGAEDVVTVSFHPPSLFYFYIPG